MIIHPAGKGDRERERERRGREEGDEEGERGGTAKILPHCSTEIMPQTFHTTLLLRILLIHTIGHRELQRNTEALLEQKSSIHMMLQNILRCSLPYSEPGLLRWHTREGSNVDKLPLGHTRPLPPARPGCILIPVFRTRLVAILHGAVDVQEIPGLFRRRTQTPENTRT